jgi:hypothetical protein
MRRALAPLLVLMLLATPGASFAGAKSAEHRGGSITFVHLPGLTTNVMRANGRWGVVTLEAGLDIPDEKLRLRAQHSIPLLLDGYTRALAGIGPSVRPGSQPDLDRVSEALQTVTDRLLGKPGAVFLVGSVIVN